MNDDFMDPGHDPGEPDDAELALEYVLGLLDPQTQAAADARRRHEPPFAARIDFWENQLARLYAAEAEVAPPEVVRELLLARLFPAPELAGEDWRRSLFWWRSFALAAGVGVIALSVALLGRVESPPQPQPLPPIAERQPADFQPTYCAWFKTDERMEWVLWADPTSGRMRAVVPAGQVAFDNAEHAMELWMLPADGSAPRSLGLMPASGKIDLDMPASLIAEAKGLAISQEPPGGSPTGLPTGPVLYQSPWWSLG